MSFFKSGASSRPAAPDYTGLQIQTAVSSLPIPILWGKSRLAPNVVWYENFRRIPGGGGGKGLFNSGSGSGETTYTADVILALCEGPIVGIDQIWRGQSIYTLAQLGLSLFIGTTPQTVWGYLAATYPRQALAYQGTTYVCAANYSLSSAATLDNHNFEIKGFFCASGVNGVDADPALCVGDLLTNAQYGIGFPVASIDSATLYGSGNDSSYQTYCAAVGIAISPCLTDQETASSILQRWLQLTNTAAVWSGGLLRFIPYGDSATLAGTAQSTSLQVQVPSTQSQLVSGTSLFALIFGAIGFGTPELAVIVEPTARFVADRGVVYAETGIAFHYDGVGAPSAAGHYGIAPTGTYLFCNADAGALVTISYTYTVAATFTPNVTPIYDLTDDDYCIESGKGGGVSEDPLQVSRSDPYTAYNIWRLEVADRNNAYNRTPVESRDQNAIELYGPRLASSVTAHEICDVNVAAISGQLLLQRALYIRNTYKFRLSWEYGLLDPMDLVTVTDSALGLSKAAIRITGIEEDEQGFLEIAAEEFPQGVATATLYPTQSVTNNPVNRNADPGSINAPLIFEPTDEFAGGNIIGMAVSGQNPTLYGGSNVYISLDGGNSFAFIGVASPATMGIATADLPPVSVSATGQTVDTVNTLAVDLTGSDGTLSPSTTQAALSLATPCILNREILCYANAALTAANKFNLTYLVRGAFGTEAGIGDHPAGTPFALLDSKIFDYEFAQNLIGTTVQFKFQPFNIWGGGAPSLADCAEYPYVIAGTALASPLPNVTNLRTSFEAGFGKIYWDEVDDFRSGIMYEWRQAGNANDWNSALPLRSQAHPPFVAQGNGTFLVKARCQPVAGLVVYSENAASIAISGNQLTVNLLASWDEKATGWSGWFDNGIGVDGGDLRLGGSGDFLGIDPLEATRATAAATASGNALQFYSLPAGVAAGMAVADLTQPVKWTGTGYISGATFTVSSTLSGSLAAGDLLTDSADVIRAGTTIISGSGSTWTVSPAQAAGSSGSPLDITVPSPIPALATVQSIAALDDFGSAAVPAVSFLDFGSVAVAPSTITDYGSVAGLLTVSLTANVTGAGVASGDLINFSVADILDYGGIVADEAIYYTIPSNHIVNAGSVVNASVNGSVQIVGVPVGQNILSIADFLSNPDVLGSVSTQYVDGWIEIATSQNVLPATATAAAGTNVVTFAGGIPAGVTIGMTVADLTTAAAIIVDTTVQSIDRVANTVTLSNTIDTPGIGNGDEIGFFGAWQKFDPNVYPAQAWHFRLALETVDPASIPYALAFNFQVQLPSRIDHYQNLMVGPGGLTITFAQDSAPSTPAPFNGGPAANGLPYYNVSNTNPFWQVTGLSRSQLTITFYADATYSTPVTAIGVNVNVEGY